MRKGHIMARAGRSPQGIAICGFDEFAVPAPIERTHIGVRRRDKDPVAALKTAFEVAVVGHQAADEDCGGGWRIWQACRAQTGS